jgi:uncharacterized protein (DUF305 family)
MAVMMSQHLLLSGLDLRPQVATLARDIRDAQRREIAVMARWSAAWFGDRVGMGMMGGRWGAHGPMRWRDGADDDRDGGPGWGMMR